MPDPERTANLPVILLAFANPYLRDYAPLEWLIDEARDLRAVLQPAARAGRCELVEIPNATIKEVLDAFQDPHYRGRIAVFHFAGHGGPDRLLLEERTGTALAADAGGTAAFLARQPGLKLVFLNACSTAEQVEALQSAGVPAVAATDLDVADEWARAFAFRFYKGLAGGSTLADAFGEAEADIQAQYGGNQEGEAWPWRLHLRAEEDGTWKLPARRVRPARSVPLQRPLRTQHFTGREQELAKLLEDLKPGKVVALCGPGGMGKSAMAAEAVWTLAPGDEPPKRFPDGVVFHTFQDQLQTGLALEKIALAYGLEPRPTPRDAALQALAGKCALLVLDGTELADDLEAVLAVAGSCGVLMTTRRRMQAVDEWQDLQPLPRSKNLDLLQAWAGTYASDDAAANEIVRLVGGLPLALFLTGRYLARQKQQASEFVESLKETGLNALHFADRPSESVPLLLERSLAQLSEGARAAFSVVGILAFAPFEREIVAAALEVTPSAAGRALGELVDFGLLLRPDYSYQVTHALAHSYARAHAPSDTDTVVRVATYYAALAGAESAKGLLGYATLDSQRAHIVAAQAAALKAKQWNAVQEIAWKTSDYLDLQGYWTDRISVMEAAVHAARAAGERHDETAFLNDLGNAFADQGEALRAIEYHEQALAALRQIGDRKGEGAVLNSLGNAYAALGETSRAIELYDHYLAIALEIGDRIGEGHALGNLGNAYYFLGETRRAIELYGQALGITREIGYRRGEGIALSSLGLAYAALGESRRAIDRYEQALVIAREIGDRRGEGKALGNLGLAYADLGETRHAIDLYEQHLAIARKIGDRGGEGNALGNLGLAYADLGELGSAIRLYKEQLLIVREIGNRKGEGNALTSLGNAYYFLGESRLAIELHEQALVIDRELGDRKGEGIALGNLGATYSDLGESHRAIQYYVQALVIDREIGDRKAEGIDLGNLGRAMAEIGSPSEAIPLCSQYSSIMQQLGDRTNEGEALNYLAYAYHAAGDYSQALNLHRQALALLEEGGKSEALALALVDLSETHLALGDAAAAVKTAQRAVELATQHSYRLRLAAALWVLARAQDAGDGRTTATALAQQALGIYEGVEHARAAEIRSQLDRWRAG